MNQTDDKGTPPETPPSSEQGGAWLPPRLREIPVIMVSGAEQSLARVRGIREFFEKPFDVSRLMAAVRRYCLPGESSPAPVETH